MKKYRDSGAKGALLDEYEKALNELVHLVQTVTSNELTTIVDYETKDEDCRSIQTILSHVIKAGYTYVVEIRKHLGETIAYKPNAILNSVEEYISNLKLMFDFNIQLFEDHPKLTLVEKNNDKKILVRWGQSYDADQLFEHAIVHILRHRRQIERFLIKLR